MPPESNQSKASIQQCNQILQLSVPHLGLTHDPLGSKGLGPLHFSGSALHSTHMSCRLRLAPLHTCHCSWWSPCSRHTSSALWSVSIVVARLHLHQWFYFGLPPCFKVPSLSFSLQPLQSWVSTAAQASSLPVAFLSIS